MWRRFHDDNSSYSSDYYNDDDDNGDDCVPRSALKQGTETSL